MAFFNKDECRKCKGRGWCKKPCIIYSKIKDFSPITKTHFSGSSPPEIFVGKYNYPNINAGVLSPMIKEDTEIYSMPEIWYEKKLSIEDILSKRGKLIYGKFSTSINKVRTDDKFLNVMQEVSMAYKPVSTEFFLKKAPSQVLDINNQTTVIANPAPLQYIRLEENAKIKPKVDYLVSDTDLKANVSIKELYKNNIPISNINKILSAGLLGLSFQRKLVPTRWSITAVDDLISKELLKKIKYYQEIFEIMVFNSEYNGNHYEILLLPNKFSFEVLEAELAGGLWNSTNNISLMKDYEFFNGRKNYAYEVTGAYYANRLALAEYLERIKKQATAIFFREVKPEYYAPLGVGILREVTRDAFKSKPEKFNDISQALNKIQSRLKIPISTFTKDSILLKEIGKQKRITHYL